MGIQPSSEFQQGYDDGRKEVSFLEAVAGMAADIVTAPFQTAEYQAGFEQGRSDRARGR